MGSGFGGLATAVRLQTRGFDVHLFEARDQLSWKFESSPAALRVSGAAESRDNAFAAFDCDVVDVIERRFVSGQSARGERQ